MGRLQLAVSLLKCNRLSAHYQRRQLPPPRPRCLPCLCGFGVPNGNELLRDDRQNLDVDSIKLIEAAPGPRLCQTAEEAPHHLKPRQAVQLCMTGELLQS